MADWKPTSNKELREKMKGDSRQRGQTERNNGRNKSTYINKINLWPVEQI